MRKPTRWKNTPAATGRETSPSEHEWWAEFFQDFRPVLGSIPRKTTNAQVRYLIRKLHLRRGHKLLDCPCGIGRVALPLAKLGVRVTGVDITRSYLDELADRVQRQGLSVQLLHCDMRRVPFRNTFDAAANLWTSFGFFSSEPENLEVLHRMYHALRPGGMFVLHVINRDWIMANFRARGWWEAGGTRVLEHRRFDYATSTVDGEWTFLRGGQETTHRLPLRVYSYHELIAMFREVGFTDVVGFGSERDEPISRESQMLWVFGTKRKARRRRR